MWRHYSNFNQTFRGICIDISQCFSRIFSLYHDLTVCKWKLRWKFFWKYPLLKRIFRWTFLLKISFTTTLSLHTWGSSIIYTDLLQALPSKPRTSTLAIWHKSNVCEDRSHYKILSSFFIRIFYYYENIFAKPQNQKIQKLTIFPHRLGYVA